MQQLNFLSVNTTKNVDTKEGESATFRALSKNDFSQHIESHLTKNEGEANINSKNDGHPNSLAKVDSEQAAKEQLTTDTKIEAVHVARKSEGSDADHNLANEKQKVAAFGNESEVNSNKVMSNKVTSNNITTDTDSHSVAEPELLMSFLSKVDKTLVEKSLVEVTNVDKTIFEKDIVEKDIDENLTGALGNKEAELSSKNGFRLMLDQKHDSSTLSQTILQEQYNHSVKPAASKLSDITTDISEVAKAITSTVEVKSGAGYSFDPDKPISLTQESIDEINKNNDAKQLLVKSLIDQPSISNPTFTGEKLSDAVESVMINPGELPKNKGAHFVSTNIVSTNDGIELPNQKVVASTAEQTETLSESRKSVEVATNNRNAVLPEAVLPQAHLNQQKSTSINHNTVENDLEDQNIEKSLQAKQTVLPTMSQQADKAIAQTASQPAIQPVKTQSSEKISNHAQGLNVKQLLADDVTIEASNTDKLILEKAKLAMAANEKPPVAQSVTAEQIKTQQPNAQQVYSQSLAAKPSNSHPLSEQSSSINAELLVDESSTGEAETRSNAKAFVDFNNPNSNLMSGENKSVGMNEQTKTLDQTNNIFSYNANAINTTSQAIQEAYDRIDHQTLDMVNPTSSIDVSQSQKTNTQLHQETIAIFRKDFSDAVKDKVMLMISQKLQQFDITLDPPELGNMQVRVNLQGEQASVNFIVQNQQAKEALDQNMHKLKDMLAEQGVDVGDANVDQQSQQSNSNESDMDKPRQGFSNTEQASDVIAHNISVKRVESSTQVVDYYA